MLPVCKYHGWLNLHWECEYIIQKVSLTFSLVVDPFVILSVCACIYIIREGENREGRMLFFFFSYIKWLFHLSINHSLCINYVLSDCLTFAIKGVNAILLLHNENNIRKYMQECLFNFLLLAFFLWKIMNCCLSSMKHTLLGHDFKIRTHLFLFQNKWCWVNECGGFTLMGSWTPLYCALTPPPQRKRGRKYDEKGLS